MPANLIDLNWIWLVFCDTEPLLYQCKPEQVMCVLTFIISSSSARVRRGIVRESKDVLREAFTPSMCPLTLLYCFCRKEEQGREDKKVALQKASGAVVGVNLLFAWRQVWVPIPAPPLNCCATLGNSTNPMPVFSFMTCRQQKWWELQST